MSHEALVELSRKLFIVVTDNAYFYNELIDNLSGLRMTNGRPLTSQLIESPHSKKYIDMSYSTCREATYIDQDLLISEKDLLIGNGPALPLSNVYSPVAIAETRHPTCWITPSPTQTYWSGANTEVSNT